MPKRFGPDGLEILEPGQLANSGGLLAYTVMYERNEETAHIDWNMTTTLTRINNRGRALGRPVVKRTRLTKVFGFHDREVGIRVSNRPAFYRLELKIRDASRARFLASYGVYVRVVRRKSDPRLLLGPPTLRAGETASIGIAEFGTGFLVFEPDYSVEAFDGVNWVPTTIQASTRAQFLFPCCRLGPGRHLLEAPDPTGHCARPLPDEPAGRTPLGRPPPDTGPHRCSAPNSQSRPSGAQYGGRSSYHSPRILKARQNRCLAPSSSSESSMSGV